MIFRALTVSLLLSATCSTCFAQESDAGTPSANTSIVSKGRPMMQIPSDLSEGIAASHGPAEGNGVACVMPNKGNQIMRTLERSGVTLSDEQVEQITSLRGDLMKNLMPKKDHVISLAGDLKDTLAAPTINDDQARRLFADIKTDIDAAYAKFVDHVIAVSHVFTADQRQKLKVAVDRWSLGPLGRPAPPPAIKTP